MSNVVRVVAGLAVNDQGQILMGKRSQAMAMGGAWECPGGKVEEGERPRYALRREWREELGIEVMVAMQPLDEAVIHIDRTLIVTLYTVELNGVPAALEHSELAWVLPQKAARELACTPAFYGHYLRIARFAGDVAEAALLRHDEKSAICALPPPGWECSRGRGHKGPCPATPKSNTPL